MPALNAGSERYQFRSIVTVLTETKSDAKQLPHRNSREVA